MHKKLSFAKLVAWHKTNCELEELEEAVYELERKGYVAFCYKPRHVDCIVDLYWANAHQLAGWRSARIREERTEAAFERRLAGAGA